MSVVAALFSRQCLPSGGSLGSRRCVVKDLKLHHEDVGHLDQEDSVEGELLIQNTPACACKFTAEGLYGHLLGVAGEDGCVRFFDTRKRLSESPQMSNELVAKIECCQDTVYDFAWITGGDKLLTASGNGAVGLWNIHGRSLGTFKFHQKSVKCVDAMTYEPSKFVSGCRDGTICVWDTRYSSCEKPINIISSAHLPKNNSPKRKRKHGNAPPTSVNTSVTGVVFQGDNKIASAGCGDGVVKVWDLRKYYSSSRKCPTPLSTFDPIQNDSGHIGISSLVTDSHQSELYATCRNNVIYKYNTSGLGTKPVAAFCGSKISSFYVKSCLSPDNKFLLSGSSCGNAFIWEVDNPASPPLILPTDGFYVQSQEVTATAWGPRDEVVTCTDTSSVGLWRVERPDEFDRDVSPTGRHRIILSNFISRCEEYEEFVDEMYPLSEVPLFSVRCNPPSSQQQDVSGRKKLKLQQSSLYQYKQ